MESLTPTAPSTVTGIVTRPAPRKPAVADTVSVGENRSPSEATSMPDGATMPAASTAALTWSLPQYAVTEVAQEPGTASPVAVPCHV